MNNAVDFVLFEKKNIMTDIQKVKLIQKCMVMAYKRAHYNIIFSTKVIHFI